MAYRADKYQPGNRDMLKLSVILNSAVETIFAAKCCAISDANLEIIIANQGDAPITLTGQFALEGDGGTRPLNLYPQGRRIIAAGEAAAFYGSTDPQSWAVWRTLVAVDDGGLRHRFDIDPSRD